MFIDPNVIVNGVQHVAKLAASSGPSINDVSKINTGGSSARLLATPPAHTTVSTVPCASGYNCLPAWRWGGFGHNPGFNVNLGFGDLVDQILDPIGQVLFWLANFWWSILMVLAQVITSFDVVGTTGFANSVNSTFASIGKSLNSTGLIFAVALLGIFGAMWKAARRGHQHGIRAAIKVLLPLGLLVGMTEAAAGHTSDATTSQGNASITAAAGTPAWMIQKLQTEVDVAGGWLATAVTPSNANLAPNQTDIRDPACTTYINVLNKSGEAALASSANSSVSSAAFLPETVSYLWEQSYLPVWTSAQFGDSGLGDRVACHYLDMKESVQPSQQAAIGVAAGYPSGVQYGPTSNGPGGVYGPLSNASQYTQDIYAWSMCTYGKNGWTDATDYANLDVGSKTLWASVAGPVCKDWWTQGAGIFNQHWDGGNTNLPSCGIGGTCNPFALTTGSKISNAVYGASAATAGPIATANSQSAYNFMTDFEGHNAGGMLMGGIVVNVVSLAMVWAMIGLSLGVVIAGFAIFILAMLLPLLLLGMALASEHQHMAKRGIKLGLSMMASKGVLMVLLGLLVLFINAVQHVWTIPPGEGSTGTAFLSVLPPMAGLAVLAMLAKRMLGISLMNPLSASRLGFSMAKEADRGWGGAAGSVGQRLSGHNNPFVRSAFGGGLGAATGGALSAFEMERILRSRSKKAGINRGIGTEGDPKTLANARRLGQRRGKQDKGLGDGAAGGPPVPGGRSSPNPGGGGNSNGARPGVSAGGNGKNKSPDTGTRSRTPAGVGAGGTGGTSGVGAGGAEALVGGAARPDEHVTWATRANAGILGARQNLNKDKLKGMPKALSTRYKQLEEKNGKWRTRAGVLGGAAALGAGLAFAPALALATGYAGMRATNRLTDRSVKIGSHVNSLYGRATGVIDRKLGLAPADHLMPTEVENTENGSAAGHLPNPTEQPTHTPANEQSTPPSQTAEPITAPEAHGSGSKSPAPSVTSTNRNQRDSEYGNMTEESSRSERSAAQMYAESQQGGFDHRGQWTKTIPNSPPDRPTRSGQRQIPQNKRNSTRAQDRRPRPPRGSGGGAKQNIIDQGNTLPAPPDKGN